MPRGQDLARLPHVKDFDALDPVVSLLDLGCQGRGSGIDKPHGLVLASRGVIVALIIPDDVLTEILHLSKGGQLASRFDVPNFDGVVTAGTGQDVVGSGMEPQQIDLLRMAHQIHERLRDVTAGLASPLAVDRLPVLGDAPQLDGGVLGGRGQHALVEGVPFEVQNGPGVAVQRGGVPGPKPPGPIVAAHVHLASSAEEGHGEVLRGGLDVLLVASHCGQTEARVARLATRRNNSVRQGRSTRGNS